MILFSLRCASDHEFEAWFRDGDGFDAQQKAGEITCPHCGDAQVEKAVMAPRIGRSRDKAAPISPAQMPPMLRNGPGKGGLARSAHKSVLLVPSTMSAMRVCARKLYW